MATKARLAISIATAAVLALPGSADAQYQSYPGYSGGYGGQGNEYRYGRYPYGNYGYDQYGNRAAAIDACARAIESRLNRGSYGNWGYNGGNYNRYRNFGRVEGITKVIPKDNGFRVFGVASSGWGGYQGWNQNGYGNYGYSAGADLRWDCRIRANGQISDLDINRRPYNWRGY